MKRLQGVNTCMAVFFAEAPGCLLASLPQSSHRIRGSSARGPRIESSATHEALRFLIARRKSIAVPSLAPNLVLCLTSLTV